MKDFPERRQAQDSPPTGQGQPERARLVPAAARRGGRLIVARVPRWAEDAEGGPEGPPDDVGPGYAARRLFNELGAST